MLLEVVEGCQRVVVGCCWPPWRPQLPLAAEEEEWPSLEQSSLSGEEGAVLLSPPRQVLSSEHAVIESMENGLEEGGEGDLQ